MANTEPDFEVEESSVLDERRYAVLADFGGTYLSTVTVILQSTGHGDHNTFYDKHVSRQSEDDPKKSFLMRMCATDAFFNADMMDEAYVMGIEPSERGVPANTMICLSRINEKRMAFDIAKCMVDAVNAGTFDKLHKNRTVTLTFSTTNCVAEVTGDAAENLTTTYYSTMSVDARMLVRNDSTKTYTFEVTHCNGH